MVTRALGHQAPVLLAVVMPPALAAAMTSQWAMAVSLSPQIVVLALTTALSRRQPFPEDMRRIEALVCFALIFIIASLLVAPPFLVLGMTVTDALFEAVSGITSTGLSVATGTEDWPVAAHLLRGWIQWCGGFAIAFAGLAIVSGSSSASLSMSSSSFARRDNLSSAKTQAKLVLISYVALSALAILACLIVIPNWWEAVSVALAAVSTGGFAPRTDSLGGYTPVAQAVVIAICISAAISLMFYVQVWRDGARAALKKSRVIATLVLMIGATAVFVALDAAITGAEPADLYRNALNFLSGFTTAGFSTGDMPVTPVLMLVLLVAMVVGGDLGSTGGGIKVDRLMILLQILRLSLLRTRVPPSAVTYLRTGNGGERVEIDQILAVSSLLLLYIATLTMCWLVFLASGVAPLDGLFEVVSALSTVGLSRGLTGAEMAGHLKFTLMLAMLMGRLEFIALIVLCLPGTWGNKE